MRNASSEFKQILKDDTQSIVNYFDITLADSTVLHIGPDRVKAGSVSITEASTSGEYFELGSAIGKILSFSIINHDDLYSTYDFYNARVIAYDALSLSDNSVEKIRHGHYTVTTPESPGSTISITAVDSIYKFDKPYAANTTFPATLLTILTDCCLDCGVGIGFSHFDRYNFQALNKPTDCTYRQVVQWVAQIAGMNARMSDLDALELVFYEFDTSYIEGSAWGGNFDANTPYATGDNLWGGNFDDWTSGDNFSGGTFDNWMGPLSKSRDVVISTDNITITGIAIQNGDSGTLTGDTSYQLTIVDNPLTIGKEDDILTYLGSKIIGLTYRPYSLKEKSNPLFTTNDIVKVANAKGSIYPSIINYIVYKPGGHSQLSAKAENPLKNGSKYPTEGARAQAIARQYTDEQLSNYDKQVQLMNMIAANAFGYHNTRIIQSDGSEIYYMHDKPLLEDSQTIYMISLDGFFVSLNGGTTWSYGFTSDGRAVVNILSAIGIVCDWIRGGTLRLGGDNNVNGLIELYDALNALVGKWDNTGMHIYKGSITGTNISLGGYGDTYGMLQLFGPGGESYVSLTAASGIFSSKGYIGGWTIGNGLYSSTSPLESGALSARVTIQNGVIVGKKDANNSYSLVHGSGGTGATLALYNINTGGYAVLSPESFSISGTKNRIAKTKNYGERLLYCYETPKPYFGDIGEASLDEKGLCYVFVDDVFYETINTSCNYQVFLQKYGQGDLWIKERTPTHFIVEGTPNLSFAWELKARQAGYEYERLDKFNMPEEEAVIDYELEAIDYVANYYKELENYG